MVLRLSDLPAHVRARIEPAKPRRSKAAAAKGGGKSALEEAFAFQLRCQGEHFPKPEREYMFDPGGRRWRFDFAFPRHMVAVEIEGGRWLQGRHQRPEGFAADVAKYNEAQLAGWLVLRVTDDDVESMRAMSWLERALHPSRAHRG